MEPWSLVICVAERSCEATGCDSTHNVRKFVHFDPFEKEWLCWDCRFTIMYERVSGEQLEYEEFQERIGSKQEGGDSDSDDEDGELIPPWEKNNE